jgi:hypothetical protein
MKIQKFKTLKYQILFVSVILLCVLAILSGISIRRSFKTKKLSGEYAIRNEIVIHLNNATGLQAIERGYGATIIGDGKGNSSPAFSTFLEMAEKGDSEVSQAEKHIRKLLSSRKDQAVEERLNIWRSYEALTLIRPGIKTKDISKPINMQDLAEATGRHLHNESRKQQPLPVAMSMARVKEEKSNTDIKT